MLSKRFRVLVPWDVSPSAERPIVIVNAHAGKRQERR